MHAHLASAIDLAGFRGQAQTLLAHQVPPDEVVWDTDDGQFHDPFATPAPAADSRPRGVPRAATAIVPASFLRLCELVVLHSDPQRFALLYRLLWRLVYEPGLRHNPIDADMLAAQQMGQAIRRDIHKMKAQVRFHSVPDEDCAGQPLQLAWFEPAHHIVEALAPWFARRLPGQRWAVLTPLRSVASDGQQLRYGPGAAAVPEDAPPQLWLARYRSVFGMA
ncbi:TIGR03915 family putative DNA repair protein [uncultured Ramlibacter sp.]|uniref:TIGR03915 family putative DNA repair protein n=1 Tax=uncultured Ramlibacter sp. TaxID=260755 RepID=UPI00260468A9|nr:TIGR03915 family putative DNA repair protein [uncultured Ramlibacter sp.]